jgi:hypothetical protein
LLVVSGPFIASRPVRNSIFSIVIAGTSITTEGNQVDVGVTRSDVLRAATEAAMNHHASENGQIANPGIFYGWYVVAAAFGVTCVGAMLYRYPKNDRILKALVGPQIASAAAPCPALLQTSSVADWPACGYIGANVQS